MYKFIFKRMFKVSMLVMLIPAVTFSQPDPDLLKASIDNGVT